MPVAFSADGRPMLATDLDRLWLARAVQAEGAPRALVAQTLVNRWGSQLDRGLSKTLTDVVREYAQPVNPRWFPGGDLFARYVQNLSAPDAARELARAVKRRDVHSVRDTFTDDTRAAVAQAFGGPLVIPPGAVDYAPRTQARDQVFALLVDGPNAIYGRRNEPATIYKPDPNAPPVSTVQAPAAPRSKFRAGPIVIGIAAAAGVGFMLFKDRGPARS
jgi:hypothetical protein